MEAEKNNDRVQNKGCGSKCNTACVGSKIAGTDKLEGTPGRWVMCRCGRQAQGLEHGTGNRTWEGSHTGRRSAQTTSPAYPSRRCLSLLPFHPFHWFPSSHKSPVRPLGLSSPHLPSPLLCSIGELQNWTSVPPLVETQGAGNVEEKTILSRSESDNGSCVEEKAISYTITPPHPHALTAFQPLLDQLKCTNACWLTTTPASPPKKNLGS